MSTNLKLFRIEGHEYVAETPDSAYATHMEGWRALVTLDGGFKPLVPVLVKDKATPAELVVGVHKTFGGEHAGAVVDMKTSGAQGYLGALQQALYENSKLQEEVRRKDTELRRVAGDVAKLREHIRAACAEVGFSLNFRTELGIDPLKSLALVARGGNEQVGYMPLPVPPCHGCGLSFRGRQVFAGALCPRCEKPRSDHPEMIRKYSPAEKAPENLLPSEDDFGGPG